MHKRCTWEPEAVTTKELSGTSTGEVLPPAGKGQSQALFVAEMCDPNRSLSSSGSAQSLIHHLVVIKSAVSSETMFGKAWFS